MAVKRIPRKSVPKPPVGKAKTVKATSPRQGRGAGTGMRKTTSPRQGNGKGTGRKRTPGSKVVRVEDNDGGMYTYNGEKYYGSSPRYRNPMVKAGVVADIMQSRLSDRKYWTNIANGTNRKGEAARNGRKPMKRTAPRRGTR